jgi:hypothetical protein
MTVPKNGAGFQWRPGEIHTGAINHSRGSYQSLPWALSITPVGAINHSRGVLHGSYKKSLPWGTTGTILHGESRHSLLRGERVLVSQHRPDAEVISILKCLKAKGCFIITWEGLGWVTKTLCTQREANAISLWNNNLGYRGILEYSAIIRC